MQILKPTDFGSEMELPFHSRPSYGLSNDSFMCTFRFQSIRGGKSIQVLIHTIIIIIIHMQLLIRMFKSKYGRYAINAPTSCYIDSHCFYFWRMVGFWHFPLSPAKTNKIRGHTNKNGHILPIWVSICTGVPSRNKGKHRNEERMCEH